MARVARVDIPDNKRVAVALTYIKGIGDTSAGNILREASVDTDTRVKDLTETELSSIRDIIENQYIVEGDLSQRIRTNVSRLREINSYRGVRHKSGLPVRGQKTQKNTRTRKGRQRSAGSIQR
ncbi:30S ribosomal protein S13 [Candidatus Saccharibacteria bacterium QS_5_54_17]|nr:MAG: 30S ribosomal protein S13 [Candidatus Saccharibacteria bacterium QS_5_54_17]